MTSLADAVESRQNGSAASSSATPAGRDDSGSDSSDGDLVAFYPDWLSGAHDLPVGEMTPDPDGSTGPHRPSGRQTSTDRLPRRRYVFISHESSRVQPHGFRSRVTLSTAGGKVVGEAQGAAVPGMRAEIAARATLDALSSAEDQRIVLSLMAARVLRFIDLPLVVVAVYGLSDDEVKRLVGAALVENSEEQAAILATLQAVDRWITGAILRNQDTR